MNHRQRAGCRTEPGDKQKTLGGGEPLFGKEDQAMSRYAGQLAGMEKTDADPLAIGIDV